LILIFSKAFWDLLRVFSSKNQSLIVPEAFVWKSKDFGILVDEQYLSVESINSEERENSETLEITGTWDSSSSPIYEDCFIKITAKGRQLIEESRSKPLNSLDIDYKYCLNWLRVFVSCAHGCSKVNLWMLKPAELFGLQYIGLFEHKLLPLSLGKYYFTKIEQQFLKDDLKTEDLGLWYLSNRGHELIKLLISKETDSIIDLLINDLGSTIAAGSTPFHAELIEFIPKTEWPVLLSKLPATTAAYYGEILRKTSKRNLS
jgi:hypothetical protein